MPNQTKSDLIRQCPALPDNVQILNLGPMARFLRELSLSIYISTPPMALSPWLLNFFVERVPLFHSKSIHSLSPRASIEKLIARV
jgi:hypothetical protein